MNRFADQTLALGLLETRRRGFTFGLFYRRSAKRYALLVAYFAFALNVLSLFELWTPFWLCLGLFAGYIFRDIGWVRVVRRTWPFSEKVTDWAKVQRLADEKESVQQGQPHP